ncbi:multidrug effflux MFS transporter [Staphylococcus haemolyticus]|uniref:multidrug effflux MFS transporter n=1 Tax=Staphylococcus haemolyticus TaxID=1283 RepID=UPI0013752C29|nr:multidrug effflux MFS transporter [Staphylococcus haemolyticus]QUX18397.1 multidrug effflux MFS transporter [Staphylococcus haemolyticus]UCI00380.1 multidrug effflux MFS transporter [Staphylococcus haemolyticus]UCI02601.1 multidrug effflux MFS transporter [Staphylococcus haemolyticus]
MDIEQKQKKNSPLFIIILGALTAIGALSIDMFLPGLPELKKDFNTTTANAQLTLSLFMIGLGLGNLIVGPISDSIGRKKPLVISMIIFALASLGIVFVENIWIMVFLRFIQGFTGGAGAVISRAIASDMYRGNELTKFLALLMLVNGVAPVIAPALGGLILSFAVWRVVFVILTLFGVLMVLGSLFKVPESLSVENRDSSGVNVIFSNFKSLLTTPRFVLPMLIQGVTFIMLFSYISASPFLVQKVYGVSPLHFSWMFAGVGITLIIASQIAGKLVDYFHPQVLLRTFTIIQIFGVVIVSLTLINHWHFALLVIGFIVLVAPVTGVATLGFSIAMEERTTGSGSASSLLGLLQSLLGGLVTPLVNLKGEYNSMPYIIIISLTAILLIILQLLNIKVFKHDKL